MRVLVADDHQSVRDGIRGRLTAFGDMVVATVATGEAALAKVEQDPPDLVLCDVRLPDLSGIAVTQRLHEKHPRLPVLILSAYDDEATVRQALTVGAAGFISKRADGNDLHQCIHDAVSGRLPFVIDKTTSSTMIPLAISPAAPVHKLSPRELEVLGAMAEGITSREALAERFGISVATIATHIERLCKKLGVSDRTQAVAKAFRDGLIQLPGRDPR